MTFVKKHFYENINEIIVTNFQMQKVHDRNMLVMWKIIVFS